MLIILMLKTTSQPDLKTRSRKPLKSAKSPMTNLKKVTDVQSSISLTQSMPQ